MQRISTGGCGTAHALMGACDRLPTAPAHQLPQWPVRYRLHLL